ncbi:MAG: hypothetical protein J3K34DRAFT_139599, partial [Monoraphidium minutum]
MHRSGDCLERAFKLSKLHSTLMRPSTVARPGSARAETKANARPAGAPRSHGSQRLARARVNRGGCGLEARGAPWACLHHQRERVGDAARAAAAAHAAPTAPADDDADGAVDDVAGEPTVEEESLEILEWPAVCRQVACFCRTPMASERVLAGLPLGASLAESEALLAATAEAMAADLPLEGILDLRPAVDAAVAGLRLNAKQLEGVASSLEAALALRAAACAAADADGPRFPLLARLAAGISADEAATLGVLRACVRGGSVTDEADSGLAATRAARASNLAQLRGLVAGLARDLAARGAAESREPLLVRGRFCVAVRSNRRSELPKGSVKLGASSSGATVYLEPAPAVELNNMETELAGREGEQEAAVMAQLSALLARRAPQLRALLATVAQLDIAAARGRHAEWLGGVRPEFAGASGDRGEPASLHVAAALHPLLLEPALPALPRPPSADDAPFAANFSAVPSFFGTPGGAAPRSGPAPRPRPLDLRVPPAKRIVAITGPNTGGKTVCLKVAGLTALMAKAGLFLPMERGSSGSSGGSGDGSSPPPPPPRLSWFGSVLADIGDSQSLQQSLSTFSGHVRRLRRVLGSAGPGSLVLLDEVGSGTDPGEGAALARAVLDALADRAGLSLATTHHAELKGAAGQDARYANASMGFDAAGLTPTYTLSWGTAGASNALDIAARLGFDAAVVADARALAANEEAAAAEAAADMARVAASVGGQLAEVRQRLARRRAARGAREARLAELRGTERQLAGLRRNVRRGPSLVAQVVARSVLELQLALAEFRRGSLEAGELAARLEALEALLPPRLRPGQQAAGGGGMGAAYTPAAADLKRGDRVMVPRLGDLGHGTVHKVVGDTVVVATLLSRVKVAADEVVLADDVLSALAAKEAAAAAERAAADAADGGEADARGRRDSAYSELLLRVDEALAALQEEGAPP